MVGAVRASARVVGGGAGDVAFQAACLGLNSKELEMMSQGRRGQGWM